MSIPSIILGLVLSTLLGAIFHLWRGGGSKRLVLYLGLSWIGFIVGHFSATYFNLQIDKVGELHVGAATVGSIIFLGIGYWLMLVDSDQAVKK